MKSEKNIPAYKFTVRPVVAYPTRFDTTNNFIPVKPNENVELHEVLDGITLTVEAGKASELGWVQQFFANERAYEQFPEQLNGYDELFRITDQWWTAIATLIQHSDEEFLITGPDLAREIDVFVNDNNLLAGFKTTAKSKKK